MASDQLTRRDVGKKRARLQYSVNYIVSYNLQRTGKGFFLKE